VYIILSIDAPIEVEGHIRYIHIQRLCDTIYLVMPYHTVS
jgi:hypothetical protein